MLVRRERGSVIKSHECNLVSKPCWLDENDVRDSVIAELFCVSKPCWLDENVGNGPWSAGKRFVFLNHAG